MEGVGGGYTLPVSLRAFQTFPSYGSFSLRSVMEGSNGKSGKSKVRKSEKPVSIPEYYPSRLEGLVWIRLGFSSDFPQELGLYA